MGGRSVDRCTISSSIKFRHVCLVTSTGFRLRLECDYLPDRPCVCLWSWSLERKRERGEGEEREKNRERERERGRRRRGAGRQARGGYVIRETCFCRRVQTTPPPPPPPPPRLSQLLLQQASSRLLHLTLTNLLFSVKIQLSNYFAIN
jgi:hypothetical protein